MENAPDIFDKMPEFSRIGSFSFLLWAILIGLFLAVIVNMGPAFITLVQTSLHRGARSAAWFAIGVILNDAKLGYPHACREKARVAAKQKPAALL